MPPTTGRVGDVFGYDVIAGDPDMDALGFSLAVAPSGATINPGTGVLRWTPTAEQVGLNAFAVWVTDNRGGSVEQLFNVNVRGPNVPPTITTAPVFAAKAGLVYRYDVDATDPDSPSLSYTLRQSPSGMTINSGTGLIEWTPAAAGTAAVRVRVDDGAAWVEQAWTITVSPGDLALEARLFVSPLTAAPNAPVEVQVSEVGAAGSVVRTLTLDGTPVPLDSQGEATVRSGVFGVRSLVATVTDPYASDSANGEFFVIDPSDTTPPVVDLIAPLDNAEVAAPTPVRITVSDARLLRISLIVTGRFGST